MHALIIEDEPLIAMLIEDCLRLLGYDSIQFAATEAEAVAAASMRCPDLITSDVRLA
jgi:CheY-like chemotaxis protein